MPDKCENWIPKAEVMQKLGFSERTIDRMVEKEQLKQGYKPIPGRRPQTTLNHQLRLSL